MNINQLVQVADYILDTLNLKKNENKSRQEQLELIVPILEKFTREQKESERRQTLSKVEKIVESLR